MGLVLLYNRLRFEACIKLKFARKGIVMRQAYEDATMAQRWLLAIRPKTLPASVSPVLVGYGVAVAVGRFHWGAALAALFTALLLQIGSNLVNDVADYQRGADTEERLGPVRVTQTGLLAPGQVWAGVGVTFGLAALLGVYLAAIGGWPVILVGLASILAATIYTVGPFPLAYHGLGDLFVMIFFGFVGVGGTAYVVAGEVPPIAWLGGLGVGSLTTAILVVNNIRDSETDRKAGRRNIVVTYGRRGGEIEYGLLLTASYLALPALAWLHSPWALLPLLSLPRAIRLYQAVRKTAIGPAFNGLLAQTAQLDVLYSATLGLGLTLGVIF